MIAPFQKPGKKQTGREYIQDDETTIIAEMVREMEAQMERMYGNDHKMLRQIHTKMHGCVKAEFTIAEDLPPELRTGIFNKKGSYPAWIRFSNSSTVPKPDAKKDIRGIAIKLMDVPGEKLLYEKRHLKTQDFLLMSSETFFSKNLEQFRATLRSVTSKNKLKILGYFLNPFHWPMLKRLIGSNIKCDHVFNIPYWSTQAYQFGTTDRAVKYFLKPSAENQLAYTDNKAENYLQLNMAKTLRSNTIRFDFFVQFQEDAEKMPIEDPTVKWTSPFIKLGEINIPPQTFNSPEQLKFGEDLSFNSWHCLPEHRPLGSFNRARKHVYIAMSKFRHKKNGLPDKEPEAGADFLPAKDRQEEKAGSVPAIMSQESA
jgi:hypothetical protein